MADHNELGKKGEEMAVSFLQKQGYKILKRNYRYKRQEVDIITEYQKLLVIVEVKTRQSTFLAGPEITVSRSKQKSIVRVADDFIKTNHIDLETRFDIISIIHNIVETQIEHLKDAFYPTL